MAVLTRSLKTRAVQALESNATVSKSYSVDERMQQYYTLFSIYFADVIDAMCEEKIEFGITPKSTGKVHFDAVCLFTHLNNAIKIQLRIRKINGKMQLMWKAHSSDDFHQLPPDQLAILLVNRLINKK